MIDFGKIFKNKYTKYIVSLLLGLGLASLFRKSCKNKNCYEFVAPPLKDLKKIEKEENIYKFDEKCFGFDTEATFCNNNKKIVDIENK